MSKTCSIVGCESKDDVTYFKFPISRNLKKKWMDIIKGFGVVLSCADDVCIRHFTEDDYKFIRGNYRLNSQAVPSIFPENKKTTISTQTEETIEPEKSIAKKEVEKEDKEEKKIETEVCTESNEVSSNTDKGEEKTNTNTDKESYKHSPSQPTPDTTTEDIEDILTNYHIQTNPTKLQELQEKQERDKANLADEIEQDGDVSNIIEIAVDNGKGETNQDCLMLLENVQVEVDPSTLMLHEEDAADDDRSVTGDCVMVLEKMQCDVDPAALLHHEDDGDDDDVILNEKKEDPISLLTSSDDDEVIYQAPNIDTVEVSDETSEDDMPLMKLVNEKKKTRDEVRKIAWGVYEYYCIQCKFKTSNSTEYKRHNLQHNTQIQMCHICHFATGSRAQFERHKRKHKDEKKFKCHLCDYKAKHNMSLLYHLKTHDSVKLSTKGNVFKCERCGFKSSNKALVGRHVRLCIAGGKKPKYLSCVKCNYTTKRRSDLERHKARKHKIYDNDDDEEYIPP